MNENEKSPGVALNVVVDAESVNKMVCEAILNSALGTELNKSIQKTMNEMFKPGDYGRGNAVDNIVQRHVADIIAETTKKEYSDKIRELVRAKLTNEVTEVIVNKMIDATFKKLHENY